MRTTAVPLVADYYFKSQPKKVPVTCWKSIAQEISQLVSPDSYIQGGNRADPKSLVCIGICYERGIGVEENPDKAVEFYILGALLEFAPAEYHLGVSYELGKGVTANLQRAFEYYKRAADQHYPDALYALALYYEQGKGGEADGDETLTYYKRAAEQAHVTAQHKLGLMHEEGKGVKKNVAKAFKWYKLAAKQGDVESLYKLACHYEGKVKSSKALKYYMAAESLGSQAASTRLETWRF